MSDCLENIRRLGPEAVPCEAAVCEEVMLTELAHRLCFEPQKPPSYPFETVQCVNAETGEVSLALPPECMQMGPPWELRPCFCCCGEPPEGDAAETVAEQRPVADAQAGESIDVGQLGAGGELSWSAAPAAFAGESSNLPGVGIAFGEDRATVADASALFLQPSGLLKRADALVPGEDALLAPDGRALEVRAVWRGTLRGPLRQLAASLPSYEDFDGPDGHLIARDGVVQGDYVVQLYQHSDKLAPLIASASTPKE